jgi:hypothetical protein
MAYFLETTIKNFSGLSSEIKPTIAAGNDVPNGSRWREVDTSSLLSFKLDNLVDMPPLLEKGGMLKIEYNDDYTDSVSCLEMGMRYLYEPPTVNG